MNFKDKLLELFNDENYKPSKIDNILKMLDVDYSQKGIVEDLLKDLEKDGTIYKTKNEKYALSERLDIIKGKIDATSRGFAFLIPENESIKDIFISKDNLNSAMQNDIVLVRVIKK